MEPTDVTDLDGQVAVVTGALRGLGRETARALAARGAHVVLAGRDPGRGRVAVEELSPAARGGISFELLDTASNDSVRVCADRLRRRWDAIDLVVCNAGIMAVPRALSADGHELQFATNHLGHFVLVVELLEPLLRAGGRVVTVTTSAPVLRPIRWEDPDFRDGDYDPFDAYGQSKCAAVLLAADLDRRYAASGLRAVSVAPGVAVTDLGRHLDRNQLKELMSRVPRDAEHRRKLRPRTPAQGAEQIVWAATSAATAEGGGGFCEDLAVHPVPAEAGGPDAPRRLWELSASLVGERVPGR